MKRKTLLKSCFISCPIDVNIDPLRRSLVNHGIEVRDAFSLPPGASIVRVIESAIREVDFVCAVVTSDISSNVIFEIGLAYGIRKPLFLLVDKESKIPSYLKEVFYVKASPDDIDAIDFNLEQFLKYETRRTRRIIKKYDDDPKPLIEQKLSINERLGALANLQSIQYGFELERLVADILSQTDALVTQETYQYDKGVDIAIWLDEIGSILGNPILVEVKGGTLSENRLRMAEEQLRSYLAKTNARAGLLIYHDKEGNRYPSVSSDLPLVIRFDVRELVEILSKGELVETLMAKRNQIAHGRV
jgi:hypothetical protein